MIIPGSIIRRGSSGPSSALLRRARVIVVSKASTSRENARVTALDIHATRKAARSGSVPTAVMTGLDIHMTRRAAAPAPERVVKAARIIIISRSS